MNNTNSLLGVLSGTPTQAGSFSFTVQVQDTSLPQTAKLDLTLVVDTNLALSKWTLKNGGQNKAYADSFSAVNGTPPNQWSITGGALPAGFTLDAVTGLVSGTAPVFGTFAYTVTVKDSGSPQLSDMRQDSIVLVQELKIPTSLPDAILDEPYNMVLTANGGQPPFTWSIPSGQLPPGFTFTQPTQLVAVFSGLGTQQGTFNFDLQVQDSLSPPFVVSNPIAFKVKPLPLFIDNLPVSTAGLNTTFHSQVPMTGGIPPYSWSLVSGLLPPGLILNTATGHIDGIATQLGTFSFRVQGVDTGSPPQTTFRDIDILVRIPLGRNDSIATATPLGNGSWPASISPFVDPIVSSAPNPDIDFYRLIAVPGDIAHVETLAQRTPQLTALDSVIEILDANGQRLNACIAPAYVSPCLNDDINSSTLDSALDLKVPGTAGTQTTFYVRVFDWRGDARPDMTYNLSLSGLVDPLIVLPKSLGPGAHSGVNYQQQMSTQGGTGSITWGIGSGALPPGWSLSSTGMLGGVATSNGVFTFGIQVTDSATPPQITTAQYTLLIADPLTISSPAIWPDACANQPYSFAMQISGGVPPFQFGFFSGNWMPLSLNQSTGVFSGTASSLLQTFTGTVSATDSAQPSSGQIQVVSVRVVSCP